MKVTTAAVLEPSAPERKKLLEGLKKAGLRAAAVAGVEDVSREQVLVLGPTVPRPAQVARQLRQRHPAALVLQAQRRVDLRGGAHADGIVPLPLSPNDLKVRLPELWRLREPPPAKRQGVGEVRSPQARAGEGILDPFTAFYTFTHFKEVLFVEVKRARRYGFPISVAMIAFDPLPAAGGDGDLRERLYGGLALAIRRSLRDTD